MTDKPLRVMMIEDEDNDHDLLVTACRRQQVSCEIERQATGIQGWEALLVARDEGRLPALVILDLDLPGFTGLELLERIRADDDFAALPVMMLTGSVALEDREFCTAADH